jgi:hypothetical protein
MEDILSQGEDRGPGQGPRRLTVIAALIAVLAGGAIYLGVARHPAPRPAAHRPLITATPLTATPAPVPTAPPAFSPPAEPDGIAGQTVAWDHNLRLPIAGARPVWFSPASGRSEPIAGLPAARSGYQFIRVTGGWALQPSPVPPAGCGNCAWPPSQVWFLAEGARSATRLGTASVVAPAVTAGEVWLTSYRQGADMTTAAGTAREASTTGTLTRPVTLPPGYRIVRGTGRGLLLTPAGELLGAAPSLLWDPAARKASQVFRRVLATSPDEIAWATRCDPGCGIEVLNLATGRHTMITLPPGSSEASGVFSPDGDFLALQVSFGNTGDGGELAMQLEVVSMTSGRLTDVPGTWASSDALVTFGWPARGDSLVAEFFFTTKVQLASWRPGASHPAVVVVRSAPSQASLVLG